MPEVKTCWELDKHRLEVSEVEVLGSSYNDAEEKEVLVGDGYILVWGETAFRSEFKAVCHLIRAISSQTNRLNIEGYKAYERLESIVRNS